MKQCFGTVPREYLHSHNDCSRFWKLSVTRMRVVYAVESGSRIRFVHGLTELVMVWRRNT